MNAPGFGFARCSQQERLLSPAIASACAELSLLADGIADAVRSPMAAAANMVEVAALVGDTARATMLAALMSGQALTGSELAFLAHISRSTASEHLAKLVEARLLAVTRKRRFSYYRISSPLVATMLENMKAVAAIEVPSRYQPHSARDTALRFARTCYDHIAGEVGVAIADALIANGSIILDDDGGEVTDSGARVLAQFGADLSAKSGSTRIFCRPCLDWSERRYHIAGRVGAEICRRCLERGWLKQERDTRALHLTPSGQRGLADSFGVRFRGEGQARLQQMDSANSGKALQGPGGPEETLSTIAPSSSR
jgi:DNA-binding transcriptional ArsR family regulator